jgi:hypothetical protein
VSDDGLFDAEQLHVTPAQPEPKLSADQRRTLRQQRDIANGQHPLLARLRGYTGSARARPDLGTCGDCRFRQLFDWHNRRYAKCTFGGEERRLTHGAATDVRASWPACGDFDLGDPKVSADAMRVRGER